MFRLLFCCVLLSCAASQAQEVCAPDPVIIEPDLPRDATREQIELRCSEIQWELNALYWEYACLIDQEDEAEARMLAWSAILRSLSRDPNSSDEDLAEALSEYTYWTNEWRRISGRMAWILNRTSSLLLEWNRLQERLAAM